MKYENLRENILPNLTNLLVSTQSIIIKQSESLVKEKKPTTRIIFFVCFEQTH